MGDVDAKTLGKRIRQARIRAGASQDDLGQAVNLGRTNINKIESGIRKVSAVELSDIAAALKVRMSSFFAEPTPALVEHRSSQGLDTADSQIDAILAKLVADVEFVASLSGKNFAVERPKFERPTTSPAADALAEQARTLMGIKGGQPIPVLSEAVAQIGLFAFSRDLGVDTADAGMVQLRDGGVSLINSHMQSGRRRLALAHELGHYLLDDEYKIDWRISEHSSDDVAHESRLDRFARALLLPESAVRQQWITLAVQHGERRASIKLASDFRVDMSTLARRLHELGITADTDSIRNCRPRRADMIELDLFVPLEELEGTTVPVPFAKAVLELVAHERISRERALDLLQGAFIEDDLPDVRERQPGEIWKYVS